ncbi:hypothetical protein [Candidatus Kuenenia stuttgartiensis]|jgi:hypothetical protein|uniref:hypothetical protein n=1 Tax=Candidatus Kuenenia TaxID=380738 RepID=UPI0002F24E2B|nr:hypothetical protein [Candidatus Kuenenia stuttgartiensis]MBE7547631.1 hypothetical protein [Planctomycetia bacterium]MCL4743709.1 hypothetical protein [Phycisphaerales bacterium]GJQ47737.1 MAG: hypothetical protein HKUEN01_01230 [Candidatus Kuenenia stuttgartiensis]
MLKKYGVGLAFIGALMFGVGTVNTVLVGSAMATSHEEGRECEKCGHLPTKPENDCKCVCHTKSDVESKCEKCGHLPTKSENDCKCVCHAKKGY